MVPTEHRLEAYATLHWSSGLAGDPPEPSSELSLSLWTWSDDAMALMEYRLPACVPLECS
jgi:hypothetical protein